MVIYRHAQKLFGIFLSDHILIEETFDLSGFLQFDVNRSGGAGFQLFFVNDFKRLLGAFIADVSADTRNEDIHLTFLSAAKTAADVFLHFHFLR